MSASHDAAVGTPTRPVLYRRGSVHTAADPGATAMIVEGEQVVWVGAEQAAESLLDERMAVVELDGALVSPAFVDGGADLLRAPSPARAAALGLGAVVHTGVGDPQDPKLRAWLAAAASGAGPAVLLWPTVDVRQLAVRGARALLDTLRSAGPGTEPVGLRLVVESGGPAEAAEAARFVQDVVAAGARPCLAAGTSGALDAVLEAVGDEAGGRRVRSGGLRIDLVDGVRPDDRQLARLAASAATVCVDPAAGLPVAELYRLGIPVIWGTGAELLDGWQAVRDLLHHPEPDQRISARAGFVAATRGAWRAVGTARPMAGQLVPGAPATFAVWEVEALMVQTAEGTGASWSTDPRARTPLLPALQDEAAPVCRETVVDGRRLPSA